MVKYESVLRAAIGIIVPSMMPAYEGIKAGIGDIPAKLRREIDKSAERGEACQKARDVVSRYNTSASVKEFIKENPSSIGTDIYKNREEKCAEFLKRYIAWLGAKIEPHTEIPDIPNIPIPKINLPDVPNIGGDIKKSAQVTGLVVMGFIALLVYLMFRGGAGSNVSVSQMG